jgi:hypothetical protein
VVQPSAVAVAFAVRFVLASHLRDFFSVHTAARLCVAAPEIVPGCDNRKTAIANTFPVCLAISYAVELHDSQTPVSFTNKIQHVIHPPLDVLYSFRLPVFFRDFSSANSQLPM